MSKDSELYKRLSDEAKAREAARLAAKDKARDEEEHTVMVYACGFETGSLEESIPMPSPPVVKPLGAIKGQKWIYQTIRDPWRARDARP